jgi:hypothetical protein
VETEGERRRVAEAAREALERAYEQESAERVMAEEGRAAAVRAAREAAEALEAAEAVSAAW